MQVGPGVQDLPQRVRLSWSPWAVGPSVQDLPHVEDLQGLPSVDVEGLEDPDLEDPRVADDDDGLEDRRRRALHDPDFRAWARQRGLL